MTVIYVFATPDVPELNAKASPCRAVCRAQGWDVVRTVRERDQDRPKLARLVEEAQSGGFARVLFFDWDAMASSNK